MIRSLPSLQSVFKRLLGLALALALPVLVVADPLSSPSPSNPKTAKAPAFDQTRLPPISLGAVSYYLYEPQSDTVLASKQPNLKRPPASLTKMMTAYVVSAYLRSGQLKPTELVSISEKAWRMPGSRTFLRVGSRVPLEKVFKGMIIQSGNDAAVSLAEHVAGNENAFVDQLMNPLAKRMGMNHTHFSNATGLPTKGMFTTAKDLATLATHVVYDYPKAYSHYSIKSFTYNDITQNNRNDLLWIDPSVDGIKTGHTEEAGYQLVSSAERDGMRLIAVVMGTKSAKSRIHESERLLNYGFRYFQTRTLYKANQSIQKLKIWRGVQDEVDVGVSSALAITLARGTDKDYKVVLTTNQNATAPIQKGDALGKLSVYYKSKVIQEAKLVAMEDVPLGSFSKQVIDGFMQLFH